MRRAHVRFGLISVQCLKVNARLSNRAFKKQFQKERVYILYYFFLHYIIVTVPNNSLIYFSLRILGFNLSPGFSISNIKYL